MFKWLDLPPIWLAAALGASFGLDRLIPGLGFGLGWMRWIGDAMVVLGLGSMGLALLELIRHHTTFVPRKIPSAFVRDGIYRLSRNPIYLGDALVLVGAVLHWDVLPALLLVPAFTSLITGRFIRGEEAGLIARFGDEVEEWFGQVRRWL